MTTLPLSGIAYGQQLVFHGIAGRTAFTVYVLPDYKKVLADAYSAHPYQTVVAMYDQAIPHVTRFVDQIASLVSVPLYKIPLKTGEQLKPLDEVAKVTACLNERAIGSKSLMLVIGGGTLCNAAGFISAVWNGMEPVVIPTNFTAIADVAVGSLHMVNVGADKNRLQLYYDPLAVVFDPQFIATLQKSEHWIK